jgi:hypothetical protein
MKVKNITDTDMTGKYTYPTPDGGIVKGLKLSVGDIPNLPVMEWLPGQTIDLGQLATALQISQSMHLRVHILEGRMAEV